MTSRAVQPARSETGTSTMSTLLGVAVVLAFLMLAAQVLVHLYASTAMSAAAYDAARLASGSAPVSADAAATYGRSLLGRFNDDITAFDVQVGAEAVTVRVTADSPALVPRVLGRMTGFGTIDRRVVIRTERLACDDC